MAARWAAAAALFLVAAASFQIASTWRVFNHTIDEPDHIAAGMEYLSIGRYLYEDAHPPLSRLAVAIGPFLAGERFHPGPGSFSEGYRILGHDDHYDRILSYSRAGNLVFFWMACAVVFLWARRAAGPVAAVVAILLFTSLPPVLAHAGLATTDMALCAMAGAAVLASLYWADRPGPRRSAWLGIVTALACVSKFSALVYLPAAWLLMGLAHGAVTRQNPGRLLRELWTRRRMVALAAGAAALTVWMVYGFTFGRVDFLHLRLPAPRFFSGIHTVWLHSQRGHPSYLLGRRSPNGFWYYFPTVLALKTPLAGLALPALSPWLVKNWKSAILPAAFSVAILGGAMFGHIDIGVRYLLPIYVGLAVMGACAVVETRSLPAKIAVGILLAWQVVSADLAHPDYLAYTNEIAARHPENFLADSDLDWGQDMKRLEEFLEQHRATAVTFAPFNRTYPLAGHPMLPMNPGSTEQPSPGWNAVSITVWKVFGYPAWADRIPAQYRVGKSILVWNFPP